MSASSASASSSTTAAASSSTAASASASSSASSTAATSPSITYYRCFSDIAAGERISSKLVDTTTSTLRSDSSTRVLTRYTLNKDSYTFLRLPISSLVGKTAFDIWLPSKGRFYVFACAVFGNPSEKKYRLNLESYGAWPEEGAEEGKLINVLSAKMWPQDIAA